MWVHVQDSYNFFVWAYITLSKYITIEGHDFINYIDPKICTIIYLKTANQNKNNAIL